MKRIKVIAIGAGILATLATALLISYRDALRKHARLSQCGNQMSSIGFAAMVWADDTGIYPADFLSLSNEIVTPVILHCPADSARTTLRLWVDVTPENISYEVLAPGMSKTNTGGLFFRCKVHGHLGYGDGTVFDGKQRRTKVLF